MMKTVINSTDGLSFVGYTSGVIRNSAKDLKMAGGECQGTERKPLIGQSVR